MISCNSEHVHKLTHTNTRTSEHVHKLNTQLNTKTNKKIMHF